MANTDLSYWASSVYISGPFILEWYQAGDGNMIAGNVCASDDADEVKIASTSAAHLYGVVRENAGIEIDTAHASGTAIAVYCKGPGTRVWVKHDGTNETVLKGIPLQRSNVTAGAIELFAYGDSTEATDLLIACIGVGAQYKATDTTAIFVKVGLGF